MNAVAEREFGIGEMQLTTFHVGELLLALPIERVQEINRNLSTTTIPHASEHVRGVINLRGDVATVIDLRRVLDLPPAEDSSASRNLIVRSAGESIGLCVDRVADIISVDAGEIGPPPANIHGADGRFFTGVYRSSEELVVLLDVDEVLAVE